MRMGIPKYRQAWSLLYCLALFALLAGRSRMTDHHLWFNVGMLLLSVGMIVSLVGSVHERRDHAASTNTTGSSNPSQPIAGKPGSG